MPDHGPRGGPEMPDIDAGQEEARELPVLLGLRLEGFAGTA